MQKLFCLFILLILACISNQLLAQKEKYYPENYIYKVVEKSPEPEGGMEAFYRYF